MSYTITSPITKVWGTTESLIKTPMFELHRLVIKPMHRCSLHIHRFKHNAFYVLRGTLYIDLVADFVPPRTIKLQMGEMMTIKPGEYHQFRTDNSELMMITGVACVALEMYYTEPLSEDIIRRNIGASIDG